MQPPNNPYEPPKSDLTPQPNPNDVVVLATRGSRFGAALLDGLILLVILIPVQYMLGVYDGFPNIQPTLTDQLLGGLAGIAAYTIINGKFLAENGQTLGKKALGIRIVNMDGSKPTLVDIVVKRYTPLTFIGLVPVVGPFLGLINALLIFGGAHRCGHDLIAGTKVIVA